MRWLDPALLGVFAVHWLVFGLRAWKSKQLPDIALSALFAFLVISYALKIWAPDFMVSGIAGYRWARYGAWLMAAFTVPRILWRLQQRLRS